MDEREKTAGVSAAVARCGYLIRYIICYLISYRICYSPSAATLTEVSTLTDLAEQPYPPQRQLALGRKRRRRRTTRRRRSRRKEKEEEEKKEKVRMDGGRLGRQEKGRRKM